MSDELVAGIFVGGRASRMGGVHKGLLTLPSGVTLVDRWRWVFGALGIRCVLVGESSAYAATGLEALADDPPGVGPMGGLSALLAHARGGRAIAVACDMPHATLGLTERLATCPGRAPIVAPRRADRWEPLFARYDASRVLADVRARITRGRHSLQGLLEDTPAEALALAPSEAEELRDWDAPGDVDR